MSSWCLAYHNNIDDSSQDIKPRAFKVIIVGPQAVGKALF